MRKTIISLLISFILFEPEYMFAQSFQWLTSMGGISSALNPGADEIVREVKVDEQGNVYACGRIRQYAAFSGITVATYGDYDIFLAKYNCQGNLVWVRTAGGSAGALQISRVDSCERIVSKNVTGNTGSLSIKPVI